jgi:hypothetical protein
VKSYAYEAANLAPSELPMRAARANKSIAQAQMWCSVDLRDGNQTVI